MAIEDLINKIILDVGVLQDFSISADIFDIIKSPVYENIEVIDALSDPDEVVLGGVVGTSKVGFFEVI